jgi:hypothetical protein
MSFVDLVDYDMRYVFQGSFTLKLSQEYSGSTKDEPTLCAHGRITPHNVTDALFAWLIFATFVCNSTSNASSSKASRLSDDNFCVSRGFLQYELWNLSRLAASCCECKGDSASASSADNFPIESSFMPFSLTGQNLPCIASYKHDSTALQMHRNKQLRHRTLRGWQETCANGRHTHLFCFRHCRQKVVPCCVGRKTSPSSIHSLGYVWKCRGSGSLFG